MKEIAGGFWAAGMLGWALFGFIPGIILISIGCIANQVRVPSMLSRPEKDIPKLQVLT